MPDRILRRAANRRAILEGALAGLAGAALAPLNSTFAAEAATTPISDTLALVTGAGGNVLEIGRAHV